MAADFTRVDTPEGVAELARAMAAAPEHAIDSEANSGFAYRERLCLLQVNVGGRLWLVDLVALPPAPEVLEPLRAPLESERARSCVHGGEYDVGLLKRDFGIRPAGLWDSQQAASLLGRRQSGYGSLVEEICGVSLAKAHAYQDWARRPLAPAALRYALDDVRYLPQICRRLGEEVRAADLDEELEIACRAVAEATWNGGFRADGIWRIKGVRQLDRSRLPLLAALWSWRDEAARRDDLPPGRLLNNALLVSLARAAPRRPGELRRLGVRGRRLERHGTELLRVLGAARESPPPVPDPPVPPRPTPAERGRGKRLRAWRREEAARRGVSEQAVLPAVALRHLTRHGASELDEVPQLGSRRIARYGDALRAVCRRG